jgi:hypothetical protein
MQFQKLYSYDTFFDIPLQKKKKDSSSLESSLEKLILKMKVLFHLIPSKLYLTTQN